MMSMMVKGTGEDQGLLTCLDKAKFYWACFVLCTVDKAPKITLCNI